MNSSLKSSPALLLQRREFRSSPFGKGVYRPGTGGIEGDFPLCELTLFSRSEEKLVSHLDCFVAVAPRNDREKKLLAMTENRSSVQ
jgi:hypothetical protein